MTEQERLDKLWENVYSYGPQRTMRFVPEKDLDQFESKSKHNGQDVKSIYESIVNQGSSSVASKSTSTSMTTTTITTTPTTTTPTPTTSSPVEKNEEEDQDCITTGPLRCSICNTNITQTWETHIRSIAHQIANDEGRIMPTNYYALKPNNPGRRILEGQGWDEDMGLGVSAEGRKVPLRSSMKQDRRGIGSTPSTTSSTSSSSKAAPSPTEKHRLNRPRGSKGFALQRKIESKKWRDLHAYIGN